MSNTWPFGLTDKPLVDGYSEGQPDTILETQLDSGPPSRRRVATDAPKPITCVFELDYTDVASFRTFYETTLSGGSDTFQWNDPIDGSQYNWQFTGAPQISAVGGRLYRVTCNLLRLVS
jgi:hypothetical protein